MTAPTAGTVAGRLPMTAVLQEPSYRRLWVSGLVVNIARWVDLVTMGWLALQMTGSPFMVGLAAFARSAPLMVVGPFAGIVADRMPRGRQRHCDAPCVAVVIALCGALHISRVRLRPWQPMM